MKSASDKGHPHPILLISNKQEKAKGIADTLEKHGYQVILSGNLYNGFQVVAQEMPHLIFCDAILTDGDVSQLYDRLQLHPILKDIPIIAYMPAVAKPVLAKIKNKSFAAVYIGEIKATILLEKVRAVLQKNTNFSPFFLPVEKLGSSENIDLFAPAKIYGLCGSNLVASSQINLKSNYKVECVPQDSAMAPFHTSFAVNLPEGDGWSHIIPLRRLGGPGRKWLDKLAQIPFETGKDHYAIYASSESEHYEEWARILKTFGIHLLFTQSWEDIQRTVQSNRVHFIFVSHAANSIFIEKIKAHLMLFRDRRVHVFSAAQTLENETYIQPYLRFPFPLPTFIDVCQALMLPIHKLRTGIERSGFKGIDVNFRFSTTLVGLDETGGVVRTSTRIAPGSKVTTQDKTLLTIFNSHDPLTITHATQGEKGYGDWYLHFRAIPAGSSKTIYWGKLLEKFNKA